LIPPTPGTVKAPDGAKGILIQDLRVQFKIEKTTTKEPNRAMIQIYNLAESTRAKLQAKGTRILLQAGYEGHLSQIFSGDSRTIDHVRDSADWITKIQTGDGERNYRFAQFVASFQPGTKIKDVARQVIDALKVDPGNATDRLSNIVDQYVSGFAAHGKASTTLDSILAGLGLQWSIQDGRMQILAPGEATKQSAVLINQQSGMLGSPEHGTPEVLGGPGVLRVKSLLNPLVGAGRQIRVESRFLTGFFTVQKVTHDGDTHTGPWFTIAEAHALGNLS